MGHYQNEELMFNISIVILIFTIIFSTSGVWLIFVGYPIIGITVNVFTLLIACLQVYFYLKKIKG